MKKVKINAIVAVIVFVFLMLGSNLKGSCQPGDPGGGDDVPITGIEWLVVTGGLLGITRIYRSFKRHRQ